MLVRRGTLLPARTDRFPLDRLFDELLENFPVGASGWGDGGQRFPLVNSWEDEKNYYVEAELPGMKREEIELSVLGNELTLTGTRGATNEDTRTFHRRERYTGKFERFLRFPVELDDTKIEASFQDGVLKITLPKARAALPRKIEVKG